MMAQQKDANWEGRLGGRGGRKEGKGATEGRKHKNEEWGGVDMTGSGAVIHLLTARATAENRSNPLV